MNRVNCVYRFTYTSVYVSGDAVGSEKPAVAHDIILALILSGTQNMGAVKMTMSGWGFSLPQYNLLLVSR
jgi:hypothetical protein